MRKLALSIQIFLVPMVASAATITIFFEGAVAGPLSSFQPGPLASVLRFGDPVYGTLTYDTSVPDTDPRPTRGSYTMTRPELGFDFYLGGARVVSDPNHTAVGVQILNGFSVVNTPVDRFGFGSGFIQVSPAPAVVPSFQLFLTDSSQRVFDDDALPIELPSLSEFDPPIPIGRFAQGQLTTASGQSPQIFVNFEVTRWGLIPEPATGLLLSVGLAGIAQRSRRRDARARSLLS